MTYTTSQHAVEAGGGFSGQRTEPQGTARRGLPAALGALKRIMKVGMFHDVTARGGTIAASTLLSFAGVVALGACSETPTYISVCELTARPAEFQGKRVGISASVSSDGIERTVLLDDTCPDRGVWPELPDTPQPSPGVSALQDAIFSGRPGTSDKHITADFTGTFEWQPQRVPTWVLHVATVTNVQSKSIPHGGA